MKVQLFSESASIFFFPRWAPWCVKAVLFLLDICCCKCLCIPDPVSHFKLYSAFFKMLLMECMWGCFRWTKWWLQQQLQSLSILAVISHWCKLKRSLKLMLFINLDSLQCFQEISLKHKQQVTSSNGFSLKPDWLERQTMWVFWKGRKSLVFNQAWNYWPLSRSACRDL